jgi:hypothetical protein
MAQRSRRRMLGSSYDKRPVPGSPEPPRAGGDGLSSHDAHELAQRIRTQQTRFRVNAIRLVRAGACCVVLVDSSTGLEHNVESREDWRRLALAGTL